MKTSEIKLEEIIEMLEKTGTDDWNKALANNLQNAANMFGTDAWQKGVLVYLKSLYGQTVMKMLDPKLPPEGVNYLRGHAAALRIIIGLQNSVEGQIEKDSNKDEKGIPQGSAGY